MLRPIRFDRRANFDGDNFQQLERIDEIGNCHRPD